MLAAMTSLAALAHAAPAPPPFDGTYYATIATVIPVLFLAIAVQGHMLDDLIKAAADRAARRRAQGRYPHEALLLLSLCGLTVIYGGLGEIFALAALRHHHDGFAQQNIAAPAAIALTIIAAAGPARIFIKAVIRISTREGAVGWSGKPKLSQHPEPSAAGEAPEAAQSRGTTPQGPAPV